MNLGNKSVILIGIFHKRILMNFLIYSIIFLAFFCVTAIAKPSQLIENMTWEEVRDIVKKTRVVIVPLGTPAKEHGPHLPMNTDLIVSDYLRDRVLEKMTNVVATPTMTYQYYSTFVEYPGTISLSFQTSLGVVLDTCRLLYKQGFKKIYILNTGIRTLDVLTVAKTVLASEGIKMDYLESKKLMSRPEIRKLIKQTRGTHADEVETSMMLYIAPQVVNMVKAKKR